VVDSDFLMTPFLDTMPSEALAVARVNSVGGTDGGATFEPEDDEDNEEVLAGSEALAFTCLAAEMPRRRMKAAAVVFFFSRAAFDGGGDGDDWEPSTSSDDSSSSSRPAWVSGGRRRERQLGQLNGAARRTKPQQTYAFYARRREMGNVEMRTTWCGVCRCG